MNVFFKKGQRISLREVRVTDADESYYNWLNDSESNQYLESRFFPNSIEQIKSFIQSMDGSNSSAFFAIVENETNIHVGNIKLGPINWIHRFGDIGLLIDKGSWGKGYASEAIKLIVEYAFNDLNLHKVTAGAYLHNQGSIRAFERNSFVVEGCKKSHCFFKGQYIDVVNLGLINESYQ